MAKSSLRCVISLRLFCAEKCFGPGIAQLLEIVNETRSLRSAALQLNMSYSKAWGIIKHAEDQLKFKLLESSTGGKGGGGAQLTAKAVKLLSDYRAFERESKEVVGTLFDRHFSDYV